jgi:Tfp pilus assembly protein PilE
MAPHHRILKRLANEESGLTLVELVITLILAIITAIALFTFQDLALRQSNRVFAKVDATQDARIAMEKIETRLHSACLVEDLPPIQPGSTATSLFTVSRYGGSATLTPEFHKIALSGTSLIDTTYPADPNSSPNWAPLPTPSTNPPAQTLLSNVTQSGSNAIFTYYPYGAAKDSAGNSYIDAAGEPYMMLLDGSSSLPPGVTTSTGTAVPAGTIPANSPSAFTSANTTTGLTTQDAQDTAAIGMKFIVDADGNLGANPNNSDSPLTVSDTVTLRITPVPSDNNQGVPAPCE